jgi:hypothetical protein
MFRWKDLMGRDTSGEIKTDGRIILMWILENSGVKL